MLYIVHNYTITIFLGGRALAEVSNINFKKNYGPFLRRKPKVTLLVRWEPHR